MQFYSNCNKYPLYTAIEYEDIDIIRLLLTNKDFNVNLSYILYHKI